MSTPTVRAYPRTLAQAFPRDARHAYSIEAYRAPLYSRAGPAIVTIAAMCMIGWLLAQGV